MGFLSAEELNRLLPAETFAYPSPIPTQSVSSDEFMKSIPNVRNDEFIISFTPRAREAHFEPSSVKTIVPLDKDISKPPVRLIQFLFDAAGTGFRDFT